MPQKPNFNGKLQIYVGEPLHRKVYRAATNDGQSMTAFVKKVLQERLSKKG